MKKHSDKITYSPSDLVNYVRSPFASWMDRYCLENPKAVTPDEETEDQKLIAHTGDEHEQAILSEFKATVPQLAEISRDDVTIARKNTLDAIKAKASIVYQAALGD